MIRHWDEQEAQETVRRFKNLVSQAVQAGVVAPPTSESPEKAPVTPAVYEIRELSDIHPSHDGITFQENPNYEWKNDRDYTKLANQQGYRADWKGGTLA